MMRFIVRKQSIPAISAIGADMTFERSQIQVTSHMVSYVICVNALSCATVNEAGPEAVNSLHVCRY